MISSPALSSSTSADPPARHKGQLEEAGFHKSAKNPRQGKPSGKRTHWKTRGIASIACPVGHTAGKTQRGLRTQQRHITSRLKIDTDFVTLTF